jgi:hypothetical protein
MSRVLQVSHDELFDVFAGNEAQSQQSHEAFAHWLTSNRSVPGASLSAPMPSASADQQASEGTVDVPASSKNP